ncbi:MAG: transcriptional repressor [Lachnospiraceae bacterium]|nr:transcriptional repressor [Lachnospiraceae bacterium]
MNLKHSKQRDSIKEFLSTRKDHPTADVVYMNVRKSFPNISLGTVYRNLTLLADIGEIARLRIGDGADHFDYDTSPHYHFVCLECGEVSDFDFPFMEHIIENARKSFKGDIKGLTTYFYGHCESCSKQQMSICDADCI